MSIDGLNSFGSLTTSTGKILKFEDFDIDKDGKISKEEYKSLLKQNEVDIIDFNKADEDGNEEISKEEFVVLEQKLEMQKAVNELMGQIALDFSGERSQHIEVVLNELKNYINEYCENYPRRKDVNEIAASFRTVLPKKYEEIKNKIENDIPEKVYSRVVEELFNEYTATTELTPEGKKEFGAFIEAMAKLFIENYKGEALGSDLAAHLRECVEKSDSEKISGKVQEYLESLQEYGSYVDKNELEIIKEKTKELLTYAVSQGINIKFGEVEITSEEQIEEALAHYDDGETLESAVREAFSQLSYLSKIDQIAAKHKVNAKTPVETNAVTGETHVEEEPEVSDETEGVTEEVSDEEPAVLSGADFKVTLTLSDLADLHITEHSRFNLFGLLGSPVEEIANKLKETIKEKILSMLEEKGASVENIDNIIDNVLSESVQNVKSSLGKSMFVDEIAIADSILNEFNANIEKVIDEMNESDKDMDLQDIDKSGMYKTSWFGLRKEIDYSKLREQLLPKAEQMCEANGVEFSEEDFNEVFERVCNQPEDTNKGILGLLFSLFSFSQNPETNLDTILDNFKEKYTKYIESKIQK